MANWWNARRCGSSRTGASRNSAIWCPRWTAPEERDCRGGPCPFRLAFSSSTFNNCPHLGPMKIRTNELLGTALLPGNGGELRFYKRGEDYAIEVVGIDGDLMNSAVHGSEERLAEMALERLPSPLTARVLVG